MLSHALRVLAPLFSLFPLWSLAATKTCRAVDFKDVSIWGANVLDVSTEEIQPDGTETSFTRFCNVTVTYTHPGQNDTIHVYVSLPFEGWNTRYLGLGGGGYAAAGEFVPHPTIRDGYATAITDAGHSIFGSLEDAALQSKSWAYLSPGNLNWVAVQNFASRALDDLPKIAKQVIKIFYGKAPDFSYWHGCSTGGRQGLMSAQRFPENYNGILSIAPAINYAAFVPMSFWPQLQMHQANYFPPACELIAITQAAIRACDELDGVKDGLVAAPNLCQFDAASVVGQSYDCEGDKRTISADAAKIANAIWKGAPQWYGLAHEAPLSGPLPFDGLASTTCNTQNKDCKALPFAMMKDWIQIFVMKDLDFDISTVDEEMLLQLQHRSKAEYLSILDTSYPDLSGYKEAGGKIIMWHGLADQLIYPNGSLNYYERVSDAVPDIQDFYRYYEVPGVYHCTGGPGAYPNKAFDALVDWVEKGKEPNMLSAETIPQSEHESVQHRILCPWPQVAAYKGGRPDKASSFACADHPRAFEKSWTRHDEL